MSITNSAMQDPPTSERTLPRLTEDLLEGSAEVLVKDGVDDRVQGAVTVADPEKEFKQRLGDLAWLPADSVQAVGEEEGEPANDKHAHDDGQHEGEAFLPGGGHFLPADGAPALAAGREQLHGLGAGTRLPAGEF